MFVSLVLFCIFTSKIQPSKLLYLSLMLITNSIRSQPDCVKPCGINCACPPASTPFTTSTTIQSLTYSTDTTIMSSDVSTTPSLPTKASPPEIISVTEEWELNFKIIGSYQSELADHNSSEHSELTRKLFDQITTSCRQVLGKSFIRVKDPLRFSNGSILVTSLIQLSENNPDITNASMWEDSLSSTLSGLFIKNSTSIYNQNIPQATPAPQNQSVIIGAATGTCLVFLALIFTLIFVCRNRIKLSSKSNVVVEEQSTGQSQLSISLPDTNKTLMWRENSAIVAVSESSTSQLYQERKKEGQASLHRSNVERFNFEREFQSTSNTHENEDLKFLESPSKFHSIQKTSVPLPRIVIASHQEEYETMTTSSTSKSLQVVVSNHNTSHSNSQILQGIEAGAKPADFGGLFVPEGTSDIGRASSIGLKLNRLNANRHKDEVLQDIDLNSLSNAGDLYSLKPTNSEANISNFIKASIPLSFKKIIFKHHDAKLHRETHASPD